MKISKEKKDKICEQILAYLYSINPKAAFTSKISQEIARDEEFVKKLLLELRKNKLVVEIKKNSQGTEYLRRQRWKLSQPAYEVYRKKNHI